MRGGCYVAHCYWSNGPTWYRRATNLDRQRFDRNGYPCQPARVAVPRMPDKIESELASAGPAERAVAQAASRVDPGTAHTSATACLTVRALRRDPPPGPKGRRHHGPWVRRTSSPLPCRPSALDGRTHWLLHFARRQRHSARSGPRATNYTGRAKGRDANLAIRVGHLARRATPTPLRDQDGLGNPAGGAARLAGIPQRMSGRCWEGFTDNQSSPVRLRPT